MRGFHALKLLLIYHVIFLGILAAYYFKFNDRLWNAELFMMTPIGDNIVRQPKLIARGAELILPWNLLPHDVILLAAYALVAGTLTICLAYWLVADELRREVAGREQAAAERLEEATRLNAEAEACLRTAKAREDAARAAERKAEERERAAARREAEAQAHIEAKDAEVERMSKALTRLKQQNRDLRKDR